MSNQALPMRPILHTLLALLLVLGLGAARAQEAALTTAPATAPQTDPATLQQALDRETAALEQARTELETATQAWQQESLALKGQPVSQAAETEAQLAVENTQVRLEGVDLDRAALSKRLEALKETIQRREAPSVASVSPDAADQTQPPAIPLDQLRAAATILERHLAVLGERKQVAAAMLELARGRHRQLRDLRVQQTLKTEREAFADQEARLERQYRQLQDQVITLREEQTRMSADQAASAAGQQLTLRIRGVEERSYLAQMRLASARAAHQLDSIRTQLDLPLGSAELRTIDTQLKAMQDEMAAAIQLQERKIKLFQQQLELLHRRERLEGWPAEAVKEVEGALNELIKGFTDHREADQALATQVTERLNDLDQRQKEAFRADLTSRHQLPSDIQGWEAILREVFGLPLKAQETWQHIWAEAGGTVASMEPTRWGLLVLMSLVWLAVWRSLARVAGRTSFRTTGVGEGDSFSARALGGMAAWWYDNRFGLLLSGLVIVWFEAGIGGGIAALALLAVGLWLWVRAVSGLTYLFIDSPLVPEGQRQPHLSRMLRVNANLGGLLGAVLLLGRGGLLSVGLTDLVDRLFMLFLLLPGVVLLTARSEVVAFVSAHIRARYWVESVRLMIMAVPLAILTAAVLGTLGYLNLAWMVARHLAWFMLVMFGWLIARGVLMDIGKRLKEIVAARSQNGLMWTEVVIEPLVKLARLALLVGAGVVLLRIYGWTRDSDVGEAARAWLASPLFQGKEFSLTYGQLIFGLAFLVAVIWLANRIRSFSYRWMYQGVQDLGVRNSISVFTQYAFILIGVLLTLNILGFDLTSLAVFAGALGVGIGFGLQNIANNFISGIILLAERPLRTGDWVTVSAAEGEVSRIGIRSVTVTTWDRQDVIIPNSDVISNSFTNWTHSDNIVRTKVPVGISYESDLRKAKEVMLTVLRRHPDILNDPGPSVWATGFADSSVDFTLVYYIDVKRASRAEVRTEIILRVWEELRRHGIDIPYQHRDIFIKDFPKDVRVSLNTAPATPMVAEPAV